MFSTEVLKRLNELEMYLYDYIIYNKNKIPYMKIRELAKETNVSTTTIIRFCNKVGCKGFTEFKIKFQMELEEKNKEQVTDDLSIALSNFERLLASKIEGKIEEACNVLLKAEHIVFISIGTSGILCKYACRYLFALGKVASYIDDPFYSINARYSDKTVFVAVSVSGETNEVLEYINKFKDSNCKLISITNSSNNTLSKMSDYNLSYYAQSEKLGYSDITTQVPVVFILESLCKKLYNMEIGSK